MFIPIFISFGFDILIVYIGNCSVMKGFLVVWHLRN